MATTEERLTALETDVSNIKTSMVSRNQVLKLTALYNQAHSAFETRVVALEGDIVKVKRNEQSLFDFRVDVRHEMRIAPATLVSAGIYSVPDAYDETSPFIIFNGISKLLESQFTLSVPLEGKFTSAVVLQASAVVLYFVRLTELEE